MARVTVGIFGAPRTESQLEGSTVRQVLEKLTVRFPELRRQLFNDAGRIRSFVNVYLNDDDVRYLPDGENTAVGPEDTISLVPSIAGGGSSEQSSGDPNFVARSTPDSASLIITLASPAHTVMDVSSLIDSVDNLVMASIWGSLTPAETADETLDWARSSLRKILSSSEKSSRRFFPFLSEQLFSTIDNHPGESFAGSFSPFDPLDVGVQAGLNTMLRRVLQDLDRERYEKLFSFAQVRRLEHHSPLLLETVVIIGAAVAMPAILLYGCMAAVFYGRRSEAEAGIRETELALKQEELKQSRLRTQVQEHIAAAIKEANFSAEPLHIPETVLAETARIATTTVGDLGKSPLIGSVTLGLSKGK